MRTNIYNLILIVVCGSVFLSCASRDHSQVINNDSTYIFPAKNSEDFNTNIILGNRAGSLTGRPVLQGQFLPIGEKQRVYAMILIDHLNPNSGGTHLFHIEWISPNQRVLYKKQITLSTSDTSDFFLSSIGTSMRETGNYLLRVYYFRELIAEKAFTLVPEAVYVDSLRKKLGAEITFCRKIDKQTGERIGADSIFFNGKKRWVTAIVDFKQQPLFHEDELKFRMEWIGPDDKVTYNKLLTFKQEDNDFIVKSSLSLKPEKRQPGQYKLNVYFFRYLIAGGQFTLKPEEIKTGQKIKWINIGPIPIRFYTKNKRQQDVWNENGNEFYITRNEKVYVSIDVSKTQIDTTRELSIHWISPAGKVFFRKTIRLSDVESLQHITSSISTDPEKRKPGRYAIRVIYLNGIAAEKQFFLKHQPEIKN